MHRLALAVVRLSSAEGEKPRRGGWPLPEAFAPNVAASIRGLLPALPSRSRASCALAYGPSSYSFPGLGCSTRMRNHLLPSHYGGSVKMHPYPIAWSLLYANQWLGGSSTIDKPRMTYRAVLWLLVVICVTTATILVRKGRMASSSKDQGLTQPQDEPKAQRLN